MSKQVRILLLDDRFVDLEADVVEIQIDILETKIQQINFKMIILLQHTRYSSVDNWKWLRSVRRLPPGVPSMHPPGAIYSLPMELPPIE